MITQIQTLIDSVSSKQTISGKDMVVKLSSLSQSIEASVGSNSLTSVKVVKLNRVECIKRYDLLYVSVLGGVPHYLLVDKVVDDKVYCLCFTSTFKDYLVLHEVTGDRILLGSYVSNVCFCISLTEAKKSFVRTYEDKREAIQIFNKIRKYYKGIFVN